MRKILKYFSFIFFLTILSIGTVCALENEPYYVNRNGVNLSKEEYDELVERFGEGYVMTSSQELINAMLENKDMIPVSLDEDSLERAKYYYSCSDYDFHKDYGDLQGCMKSVVIPSTSTYTFELFVEWNKEGIQKPMVKSFDILAMNWSDNFVATSYTGTQWNAISVVNYSNRGGNSKWNTNGTGAGISMNIMNDTQDFLTMTTNLTGYFTSKKASTISMLYIHAYFDVTKTQSMSYEFAKGKDSLGNVLKFKSDEVRSRYAAPVTYERTFTPQYIK